jgi:hypothetical protein
MSSAERGAWAQLIRETQAHTATWAKLEEATKGVNAGEEHLIRAMRRYARLIEIFDELDRKHIDCLAGLDLDPAEGSELLRHVGVHVPMPARVLDPTALALGEMQGLIALTDTFL